MRLYVETNFILELAFLREEHDACEDLLALSEEGKIELFLPVFSVGETYEAWARRSRQRAELHSRLRSEILDLSRSKPYQQSFEEFRELTGLLTRTGGEERHRLDEALERVLGTARVIPIELRTIRAVQGLQTLKLSPQDLIVYASVLSHLEETTEADREDRMFITRNTKDFASPDVRGGLTTRGCRLFTSFRDVLGFSLSRL